jgi:hypothetical protein
MARPFESRIQDLLYNVEVGVGLRIIKVFLYIIGVCVIMVGFMATQFKGFASAESMEYGQLGRNIADGKGFSTHVIRPSTMWFLIENADSPEDNLKHHTPHVKGVQHPDLYHAPIYPMFLGAFFKVTKTKFEQKLVGTHYAPEQYIVIANSIIAALTGFFIFLLARRLFDQRVAVIGTSIYYMSEIIWQDAISGLPITMAVFWGVLVFYFATLAVTNKQEGHHPVTWIVPWVFCTLFMILLFHTRYASAVILPGLLLYIGVGFRRFGWAWSLLMLGIFLGAMVPWVQRNLEVSNSYFGMAPYNILKDTAMFPTDQFDRTFDINLASEEKGEKIYPNVREKFMNSFPNYFKTSPRGLGDSILICLFITTFFYRFTRPHVHLMRWCIALSWFVLIFVAALYGEIAARVVSIFWPLAILYGTAFFFLMLDRLAFRVQILNMVVTVLFVLINAFPLIFTLFPPQPGIHYPPYAPQFIFHLTDMLKDDEVICSDMPWATAWYGKKRSILIPQTLNDFYDINDYTHRISALFLTPLTRNKRYITELKSGPDRSWFFIHEGRLPEGWPLRYGFPLLNNELLFLTDSERWEK